mgnify:CR=1 FL=1
MRLLRRLTYCGGVSLSLLLLGGCATNTSVIDAGCATYRSHDVRPSREDTLPTIHGLIVQREAMAAACA